MEDEETQRSGVVIVLSLLGTDKSSMPTDYRDGSWQVTLLTTSALPLRIAAVHICYDDPNLFPVFALGVLVTNTASRLRLRCHFGTSRFCPSPNPNLICFLPRRPMEESTQLTQSP